MSLRPRLLVGVGVAALLLVAAVGAGAEGFARPRLSPVLGRDVRISGPKATSDENYPAVAWNETANQGLVVWRDDRNYPTRYWDIYGRRMGADGTPIGADIRISGPGATAWEDYPAVAWNQTANEYLVVWEDLRLSSPSEPGLDIYGRRVGADGKPIGADFRISGPSFTRDERYPAVVWNQTANQYLVIWEDDRETPAYWDVYGRRVGADGKPIGADFRISGPGAALYAEPPAVAWNRSANQYLVVWQDDRGLPTRQTGIYGRRVRADGTPIGADFPISRPDATSPAYYPAVAWSQTANQYLVVWEDMRNYATREFDVYGRRVGANGGLIGADTRISGPNATGWDGDPAVAWNQTANQYLVVWEDGRDSSYPSILAVYGRRVGADGKPTGADIRITGPNASTSYSGYYHQEVAWSQTANQYLVVWQDYRNDSTRGWDIYGRRVSG